MFGKCCDKDAAEFVEMTPALLEDLNVTTSRKIREDVSKSAQSQEISILLSSQLELFANCSV